VTPVTRGNRHAHKTKAGSEKGSSEAEIDGGRQEDGKKEAGTEGGRHESCEYDKAESSSLEGRSDHETTGCCRRYSGPRRSSAYRS
jgi:hypothetical protein